MSGFRSLLFARRTHVSLVILAAAVSVSLAGVSVEAQTALPAAIERTILRTADHQAELRRILRKHAPVLEAQSAVLRTVAKLVGPAVVYIEAEPIPQGSRSRVRPVEEAGSGVIIRLDGKHYILTNGHVVRMSSLDRIKINLADGRRVHPTRLWSDVETDIAVMAVEAPDLVAADVGDSDRLDVGDFVLALGSPFGLSNSVSYGIISAKGRHDLELGQSDVKFQDFLQTDAAINPGNSGGPLVNLQGEVIGIATAIASNSGRNEGIGFAIPSSMFMHVADQLVKHGIVTRAFLGVHLKPLGPAMAAEVGLPRPVGARITAVTPGTPAAEAALRVGDVILQFDNRPVEDDAHLVNLVTRTEIGKDVEIVIFRDRKPVTMTVKLADRRRAQ